MKKILLATIIFVIIYFGINLNLFAYDYYDCIFSPNSTYWQFSHQSAYRLTTGKTANNTPTGHIQVQTEGMPSINQGSLVIYINGSSVSLYTDPNLENSIGKNYSYQAGSSNKELWFYTGFGQDCEIKLKHIEVQTWYVTWNMAVSCPDSNSNAPTIKINLQPDSNDSLALGQTVPVQWTITSSNTITHSHLSLYQNQVKKRTLCQPDRGGFINYLWFVTDIPSGSGYQLGFYAKDNKGNEAEIKANVFSIGSELIFNIPGYLLGSPEKNGNATPEVGFGVNSVSGNFYHNETDVSLPGIELPFTFTRHYNSQAIPIDSFGVLLNSPFGWNWSHSYLIQLRMNTSKTKAELIWDDGRRDLFERTGNEWRPVSPGNFSKLNENYDGAAWCIKTEKQTEYLFDSTLKLYQMKSRTGHSVYLQYDGHKLSRIIDTAKRVISFSYTDNKITQVDIPPSRHLRFAYTKGGLLSKVWDMRGNYHRYVYRNQNHFAMLIEIHQANVDSDSSIRPKLQIIYDDNYRVIEQHTAHTLTVDSSGYLFDWNIPKTLVYNSPTGKGASFYWNENGQVYKIVPYNYPAGVEENFTYAASFGPQSVLTKTLKDANNQLFSFSYGDKNSPNHPSQFDLPDGRFFSYAYNPTHDLVSLKTPEGMNADWIRNQYGKTELINIKGKHIPSVIQTKMTYQPDGQLSQVSKDNVIKYKVESLTEDGQPLEVKHYVSATSYLTTKYMYDSAGRLVSSLDHRGTYTCFYYDNNDNLTNLVEGLTSACSLAPASASIRHTHYEFDAENRLITLTEGLGGDDPLVVKYLYSDYTGMLQEIKSSNRSVKFNYDDHQRLFEIYDNSTGRKDRFYQHSGGLVEIVNANANKSQSSSSQIERLEYDVNGNLNRISSCQTLEYPDISNSGCISHDQKFKFFYNSNNQIQQTLASLKLNKTSPNNERKTTYQYTNDGRTITVIQNTGTHSGEQNIEQLKKTQIEYDAAGRLVKVTEFDKENAYITRATYDNDDRLIRIVDQSNLITSYTYDRLGRLLSLSDLSGTLKWEYDDNTAKVKRINSDNSFIISTYDRLGQLSHQTTSDGNTFSFFYDDRGRLIKEIWSDSKNTYERNYTYNTFGELILLSGPFDQDITYTRDSAGRITSKSYAGITIQYTYDAFNNIVAMNTPAGNFQFSYMPNTMDLESIVFPNGIQTDYQRNALGELELLTAHHKNGNLVLQYDLTLDALGRRKQILSNQPLAPEYIEKEIHFQYRTNGLLEKIGESPVSYDARGNIISLPYPLAGSFEYDVMNRLIKADATRHYYDSQRNRIKTVRNGIETRYLQDVQTDLSYILASMDANNNNLEIFIYGPGGLLASIKNNITRFVHQDFNYNVVARTDINGKVISSFAYTPYGINTGQKGETDFSFRFAGGLGIMTDKEGIIQMRARYYHSGIRQFTSADIVPGFLERPQSLGRYSYIEGMALGGVDPSGLLLSEVRNAIKSIVNYDKVIKKVTRIDLRKGKRNVFTPIRKRIVKSARNLQKKIKKIPGYKKMISFSRKANYPLMMLDIGNRELETSSYMFINDIEEIYSSPFYIKAGVYTYTALDSVSYGYLRHNLRTILHKIPQIESFLPGLDKRIDQINMINAPDAIKSGVLDGLNAWKCITFSPEKYGVKSRFNCFNR